MAHGLYRICTTDIADRLALDIPLCRNNAPIRESVMPATSRSFWDASACNAESPYKNPTRLWVPTKNEEWLDAANVGLSNTRHVETIAGAPRSSS